MIMCACVLTWIQAQ